MDFSHVIQGHWNDKYALKIAVVFDKSMRIAPPAAREIARNVRHEAEVAEVNVFIIRRSMKRVREEIISSGRVTFDNIKE